MAWFMNDEATDTKKSRRVAVVRPARPKQVAGKGVKKGDVAASQKTDAVDIKPITDPIIVGKAVKETKRSYGYNNNNNYGSYGYGGSYGSNTPTQTKSAWGSRVEDKKDSKPSDRYDYNNNNGVDFDLGNIFAFEPGELRSLCYWCIGIVGVIGGYIFLIKVAGG